MKPFWEITAGGGRALPRGHAPGTRPITEYFRGGGFSSGFLTHGGMPCTMSRLNLVDGTRARCCRSPRAGPSTCPEKVHETLERAHQPDLAHALVRAARRRAAARSATSTRVMNNWGANHGAISYGHIGADLITLASMLRIPVSHAQRGRGGGLPAERVDGLRRRTTRRAPTSAPARPSARCTGTSLAGAL